MEKNKLSQLGLISGATFALSSWIRYFIMWPDMDKAIGYGVIGLLIMGASYLYNEKVNSNIRLTSLEEFVQDKWLESQDGN